GRLPFRGSTWEEFRRLHQEETPPPLPALRAPDASVALELCELLHACLAKRPGERISSFGFLRKNLARLHARLTGQDLPPVAKNTERDAAVLVERAASLMALGRKLDEVMPLYEEARRLQPSSDYVWLKQGHALAKSGRQADALPCYEKALQ